MNKEELNLYSLSKLTIREILIEEKLEYSRKFSFRSFKSYLTNQKALKRKLVTSKILGAFIFGILPIIPFLSYSQILKHITNDPASIRIILFGGSLIFGIFFILQFFNFFLMAVLNITRIMSGRIFDWYRTLPITREKLRKLTILTIIRSLDIPLIVITLALPILMFIGTQNLIITLVSFGVSILNTIFSFCVVVLFGERLNRILDFNKVVSKKGNKIRLINMISYIIIVVGSIFLIQWSFTALDEFFDWFVSINYNSIIILILSMIPFPFSSGYLISAFIAPSYVPLYIWYNILVGSGLFLIIVFFVYTKVMKKIKKKASLKFKTSFKSNEFDKELKIKRDPPILAYIRKDLLITFRDLKTFLSLIMPIILNFVMIFTYNLTKLRGQTPFDIDLIYNWAVILAFQIIISGMLVFSLLNIEDAENSVLSSLPLIPKDQAIAKLLLILLIQNIALLGPIIIYVNTPNFLDVLLTVLFVLPFALIFVFLIFDLRIYFFGKLKHQYVIEEVFTKNKAIKRILIFSMGYFLYFSILIFAFYIYFTQGGMTMVISLFIVFLELFFIVLLIFFKMFPIMINREKFLINYLNKEYKTSETIETIKKNDVKNLINRTIYNNNVIVVNGLKKHFGKIKAVNGISFSVRQGEVFGLLGPNGAGKTTIIKLLLGLLVPNRGEMSVLGLNPEFDNIRIKQLVGYASEEPLKFQALTSNDLFNFITSIRSLEKNATLNLIKTYLESFEIKEFYYQFIDSLSHGNNQKLKLILSILHQPDLLILDEPIAGLDPKSIKVIKSILKFQTQKGGSVLLSTHIMEIAEELCDRIGILHKGRIVGIGKMEELCQQANKIGANLENVFLRLTEQDKSVNEILKKFRIFFKKKEN